MADDSREINQDEIEALLRQVRSAGSEPAAAEAAATPKVTENAPPVVPEPARQTAPPVTQERPRTKSTPRRSSDDIDLVLRQTEAAISSIDHPVERELEGMDPFELEDFSGTPPSRDFATLDLLRDVELDLKIELGRTRMYLEDLLRLKRGSVVALDKLAGDPVDVYVNCRLVARGEILVMNDNFCVRVAELVAGDDLD